MTKKKRTKRKRTAVPATCGFNDLCRLRRDNFNVGDFGILTDSLRVWISEQKMGEPQKQGIEIPRQVFNRLIRWYLRPHKFIRR